MPVDTGRYEYNWKELENGTLYCERSLKTNKDILTCKKGDWVGTIAFDDSTAITTSDTVNWYIDTVVPKAEVKFELTEPKICKCCGAIMHDKICEYCGVEYNYKEV